MQGFQQQSNVANTSNTIYTAILVTTKGTERGYSYVLETNTWLDLSENDLQGSIPDDLASLVGLRYLNLSGNNLQHNIPPSLGDLKFLESMDLSNNQISGPVPSSLTSLYQLSFFNVSNNLLSGPLPHANQFQTFEADSFSGNAGLCGPPLPPCSSPQPTPGPGAQPAHEDSDDTFMSTPAFALVQLLALCPRCCSFCALVPEGPTTLVPVLLVRLLTASMLSRPSLVFSENYKLRSPYLCCLAGYVIDENVYYLMEREAEPASNFNWLCWQATFETSQPCKRDRIECNVEIATHAPWQHIRLRPGSACLLLAATRIASLAWTGEFLLEYTNNPI